MKTQAMRVSQKSSQRGASLLESMADLGVGAQGVHRAGALGVGSVGRAQTTPPPLNAPGALLSGTVQLAGRPPP